MIADFRIQDSAGRWRDTRGRFASAPQRTQIAAPEPVEQPLTEYCIAVFDEPRTPWRTQRKDAMRDAIREKLASWDNEAREHYLAVPVSMLTRSR